MKIEKALTLKIDGFVNCPADRGDPAYTGRVTHVSPVIDTAHNGSEYIWVTVKHPHEKRSSVWPSNRLG